MCLFVVVVLVASCLQQCVCVLNMSRLQQTVCLFVVVVLVASCLQRTVCLFGGVHFSNSRANPLPPSFQHVNSQALFTKGGYVKTETALTGMDLVRLTLERAADAKEGLEVCLIAS